MSRLHPDQYDGGPEAGARRRMTPDRDQRRTSRRLMTFRAWLERVAQTDGVLRTIEEFDLAMTTMMVMATEVG
jgi:hypothetical protein